MAARPQSHSRVLFAQLLFLSAWTSTAIVQACAERESGEHGLELLQQRMSLHFDGSQQQLGRTVPMTWIHFPKAGSSFVNVLIHMPGFCPAAGPELSVDEDHFGCRFATNFYKACPDLCDAGHMRCQASPHECVGSRYPELEGHMVGLFRQPEQRTLSAYHDDARTWMVLGTDCTHQNNTKPPVPIFARYFAGTVAYQLVGDGLPNWEAGGHFMLPGLVHIPERTPKMAEEAMRRLRDGFAFVGITEEWDLSICLFHSMFGGQCRATDFQDTRSSVPGKSADDLYDTAPLEGFHDEIDGMVYQEAVRIFRKKLLEFNVTMDSCAHWMTLQRFWRFLTFPARRLPDVYIVGAAKSGTSALYSYLSMHPSVKKPFLKENRFLTGMCGSRLSCWRFRSLFPTWLECPAGCLAFDSDATASFQPELASALYKQATPNAKIILSCREPCAAAFSLYKMRRRIKGRGEYGMTFRDFYNLECSWKATGLLNEEMRMAQELDAGCCPRLPDRWGECVTASLLRGYHYAEILQAFRARFDSHNILVIRFKDLVEDTEGTVRRIFEFLGLEKDVYLPDLKKLSLEDVMDFQLEDEGPGAVLPPEDKELLEEYFKVRNEQFAAMMAKPLTDLW
ncbi:Pol [Symbiodinium pilosum]|uniref:Pol protein n=1 Tax=Symbiodinium pilosum TaxID=2952 RepID=A0A812PQ69_SYMPI|nr:Pol [Symbiodinium pilosum]